MEVPKTTESRFRDGSVQARQVVKRLYKQPIPPIYIKFFCKFSYEITGNINVWLKEDV